MEAAGFLWVQITSNTVIVFETKTIHWARTKAPHSDVVHYLQLSRVSFICESHQGIILSHLDGISTCIPNTSRISYKQTHLLSLYTDEHVTRRREFCPLALLGYVENVQWAGLYYLLGRNMRFSCHRIHCKQVYNSFSLYISRLSCHLFSGRKRLNNRVLMGQVCHI